MERTPPLVFVLLLCAAFLTAAAASASIFPPFLARHGSASAVSAAQLAKPLKQKGKVLEKRAAKLRPTRKNGKVIGDKWASGKMVFKTVMYSASSYAGIYACNIFKIDSGGQTPGSSGVPSCTDSPVGG
ncbi:unnamed protein product [Closterium sp. NIES-65]|nr:unnamed protein product [Closterium sp. NIES-65]